MNKRAEYIRKHFSLENHGQLWAAVSWNSDGSVRSSYSALTKEEACYKAHCQWGHFNYGDEAEAFRAIFP